jgi:hypothetical protein
MPLPGHQDQLGAVGGHGRLAFGGGVVRHDQDHLVTLDRRGHGQGDAGVARGGFDQGIAGLICPRSSARVIIDSAGRSLTEPAGLLPSSLSKGVAGFAGDALQANQRRVADAIGDGWVLQGHGVFAIRTAGAPIIPANLRGHITQSVVL